MIPLNWLDEAAARIAPYIRRTPLTYDSENDIYLKWENHQVTGSFKARGAFNKILSLEEWERQQGLVTASAGNHGQGVALAGRETGAKVTVFASEHAVPKKLEAMQGLGAEVRLVAGGYGEAEAAALAYASQTGSTWVSPYNDGQVIAGQGTAALEVIDLLPPLTAPTWVVPVGGGGLASGIGAALEARRGSHPGARLVGVQSQASAFMHAIYYRGTQDGVADLPSAADGLSGPVEEHSLTIPMLLKLASGIVLVTEEQITQAVAYCWQRYEEKIEGSAAAALASVLFDLVPEKPAIILISGGNISDEAFISMVRE